MTARPPLLDIVEELRGQRVVLRRAGDADAEEMFTIIRDSAERIKQWMPWPDSHKTIEDTREFIRRSASDWMLHSSMGYTLFERESGVMLGGIGFHVHDWQIAAFEIGYWLSDTAEGHGYASEAVRVLTTYLFDSLGARRIMIGCDARNSRSSRVPERLGYVLEGCLRGDRPDVDGNPRDSLIWAMLPDDYRRARSQWTDARISVTQQENGAQQIGDTRRFDNVGSARAVR